MVVDTSAVIAILQGEPERHRFLESLEAAGSRLLSVATFVESSMVVEARRGADGLRILDRFVERVGIELVLVDVDQGRAARDAFSRYGKGRHRAGLNYGDCFPYALARTRDEPLLCKGDDFAHTDLVLVG